MTDGSIMFFFAQVDSFCEGAVQLRERLRDVMGRHIQKPPLAFAPVLAANLPLLSEAGGGGVAKDESCHIKKHEHIKILQ